MFAPSLTAQVKVPNGKVRFTASIASDFTASIASDFTASNASDFTASNASDFTLRTQMNKPSPE